MGGAWGWGRGYQYEGQLASGPPFLEFMKNETAYRF